MPHSIASLFPQISLINSAGLRDQVVTCWEEAVRRGGWIVADLDVMPFSLLAKIEGLSLAVHTRAVTDCSLALGKILHNNYQSQFRLDFDILTAGAVLHDVGKPLEYCRTTEGNYIVSHEGKILRHPISGCALAAECGLPVAVQHIIAVHSREGDGGYRSPEAWIVHHADFVNFEPLRSK